MQYPYQKSYALLDEAKLKAECIAAGLPVTDVQRAGDAPEFPPSTVVVVTSRDLTGPEKTTLDGVVAAHDGRPRRPRPLPAIHADVLALNAQQKLNVANDLFGAGSKWATDAGSNRSGLFVMYTLVSQLGLTAAQTNAAKAAAAAMFAQDFPGYLVRPAFDGTINVPGDEVAT